MNVQLSNRFSKTGGNIARAIMSTLILFLSVLSTTAGAPESDISNKAQAFIDEYTKTFLDLYALSAEAEWASNTVIIDGVGAIDNITKLANEAMARHTGSVSVIEHTKKFLNHKDKLTPLQVKQLEVILYGAANNPQTVPDLVKKRIAAETRQNTNLFGYSFKIDGEEVTPNQIDSILYEETDPSKRLKAWEASKEVGKELKEGLAELVDLRNKTVQALDYHDYFDYQVSDYGMTSKEMMEMNRKFMKELRPLYRELHTWARHELAEKYGAKKVPDLIPAHWLPNRWGQDWAEMVKVEGIDLDGILEEKGSEWLVKQSERFYISLGFDPLPESFYTKSSLYPVAKDAPYKKNTHASAWHMNLQNDLRSLMSVEPNARWYETTHHELGHIYYYMAYTNPEVPPLLRRGANRGFHEAVGSLLGMASTQKPFLAKLNLIDKNAKTDEIQILLREALGMVVFIPFSAGTMTHFEHDLYSQNLSKDEYNARWWSYVQKFQGIEPPSDRDESYCDAATKTHINNDAAQYYDYAISYIILHQLHAHIAKNILKQDPRATNYYGNKEIGTFLHGILKTGSVVDWRKVMRDNLGEEISAKPMLDYFEPLMAYLKKQNKGRKHTLPAL
ncbi:M2 family metallopeptidase [Sulfidibacter corallicola]|uniref:M2 family metallopeptidase n=1 Tax=Sulfidibacter corallicola TaxID=2818388 RepID=A0A8A4TEA0_SULCO|nr:M2 family metallopeptidase [Sulfidibacter corallicola]QTD47562.1 M2 family metallopeptidase [Sulfidibacter corallicola]